MSAVFRRLATTANRLGQRSMSTAPLVAKKWSPAIVAIGAGAFAAGTFHYNNSSSNVAVQCAPAVVPHEGLPGTDHERSFIAIKPDGVQRHLIGEIVQRFEKKGFTLVAMKLVQPSPAMAAEHYADLSKKPFFKGLVNFFSSGPVVAMVWQGKDVIKTGRKMLGETDPAASAPGTIRGDYAIEVGRNICHGSDGPEGAAHEINFWFGKDEIYDWTPSNINWKYE